MRASALVLLLLAALAVPARAQEAPAHPRELHFPELRFEPPAPDAFRERLPNGLTAYLVPDDSVPAIRVRAYIRTGSIYDPEGKSGLAGLAFAALRAGGAGRLGSSEIDMRLDELGASIDTDCSETRATVDAWTLTAHADEVLGIFADVLRRPRFDKDRIERIRDDSATEAKTDEDDSSVLATRRMRAQIYGEHPYARFRSDDSLSALERKDLVRFHKAQVTPGRVVLAVSGRFEPGAMRQRLEKLFGRWKAKGKGWEQVPAVNEGGHPGILVVDRPDMTAAYMELGHLGIEAGAKEEPALVLTDHIWGSGSFTSRVVAKVRTEEGLAYTCGSDYDTPPVVPGVVRTFLQCGASEASYALKLALDEARRLAADGPTPAELLAAKEAVIRRFPSRFTSAADRARALAEADHDGLPDDYLAKYRDRIAAVTADDVKAAAARFFGPEGLSIVVIGPADAVRRSVARGTSLDELGKVTVEQ